MKFYFISENKFYLSLLVLFFFTSQCVVTINASNSCNNTCSTCQNTLYYLKFRGSANCRLSLCPNQCMMISNQWNNDRLNHFSYFKENKINICETCFRAGLCHINDCLAEKAVIKDAINSSLNQITLHYLKENKDNFQLINKKSDSYFSNMSFIFNSLEKIGKIIKRYDNLYKNSIKMKFYFKKTIAHISKRNNVSLSDFDLGIDLDDEINTKGFSNKLKESQITFKALEIQKIHFKDDQLYISNEIQNDNIVLSRIINFDNLIKNLVDEGNKLKTKLKTSILKNLRNSEKLIKIISTLNKKGDSSLKKQKIFKKNEKKKKIVKKKEEKKKEITLEERKSSVSEVDNQVLKNSLAINLKKESKIIKEQKEKKKIIKNEKNKRIKNKIKKIKDKTIKKTNEHDQPIKNNKEKIAFNRKNIINEIKKTKDVKLNTHKVKSKKSKKERKNKTKKIKKDVEDKLLLIPFKEKKKKNEILKQNLENMLDNFFTKKKTEMYGKETINNKLDVMSKNEFSENKEKTLKNENKIDPPSKKQSFFSKKITLRKKDKKNKVLYKSSLLLDKTLNNSSKKKNEGNFINEQIFTEKKNLIKKIKKNNPHDLKFNPKKDVEKSSKKQCELERKSKQISKNIKLQK